MLQNKPCNAVGLLKRSNSIKMVFPSQAGWDNCYKVWSIPLRLRWCWVYCFLPIATLVQAGRHLCASPWYFSHVLFCFSTICNKWDGELWKRRYSLVLVDLWEALIWLGWKILCAAVYLWKWWYHWTYGISSKRNCYIPLVLPVPLLLASVRDHRNYAATSSDHFSFHFNQISS